MKKIIKIGLLAILAINLSITFTSKSFADTGVVTGTVEYYRVHDATITPAWAPPLFWVTLNGVTSAGACPAWTSGKILFVATSKEELALIISSATSGHAIAIAYDTTDLVNGYCRAQYITAGNPPPSY